MSEAMVGEGVAALSVRGIDKSFPGVHALKGIDLDFAARHDPRGLRRERRGQIDPHAHTRGPLPAPIAAASTCRARRSIYIRSTRPTRWA